MIIVSYFGLNSPGQDLLPWRASGYCMDIIGSMNNRMVTDASRDTSLGYDFGARNYLPAIPRWNSMDPLAEKYYSLSPYVYCAGNPVNLVDRDGKDFRKKRRLNTIIISADYYARGDASYLSAKQGAFFEEPHLPGGEK